MSDFLKKLARAAPRWPSRRYTMSSGTNTWCEWREAASAALLRRGEEEEEALARYERSFAECAGCRFAVAFGAGRMALYAILEALDIGEGDEVIIPAFTCVVVPNAIIYRGARPVYADIDGVSFNVDAGAVARLITPRTRALYAQHTFGMPCDMEALRAIAERHGLPIIEDAAHALGASYQGAAVGSLGTVAFFSTDHTKMIGTVVGGMATTNDPALATKLRAIQCRSEVLSDSQCRKLLWTFVYEYALLGPTCLWIGRPAFSAIVKAGGVFHFDDELDLSIPRRYPYPCAFPRRLASLGLSQLSLLSTNLAHRRGIAGWLEERIGWYAAQPSETRDGCSWLRYAFLVQDRAEFERRADRWFDPATWFTSVVHGRNADLDAVHYLRGSCPTAEWVTRHVVNLPTHPRVPLGVIEEFWESNGSWVQHAIVRAAPPVMAGGLSSRWISTEA